MMREKRGEGKVNENQLQQLIEVVSLEYFQKPFQHKAIFNRRLRTTGGRYLLHTHEIELNETYYQYFGKEALIEVIKHELCHYHLHLEGKGYKHRDTDFRQLLKAVNAPMYCRRMGEKREQKSTVIRKYQCISCKYVYTRKRRMNLAKYVCGKCKGKLQEINDKDIVDRARKI